MRKKSVKDFNINGNPSDVNHLIHKRIGAPVANAQISFEANLRTYRPQSAIPHSKKFILFTGDKKKDILDYPEFLPPQNHHSTTLLQSMPFVKRIVRKHLSQNRETISGFEGSSAYPQYTDKCFINANVNERRHLLKSNKHINTLMWESNLRGYNHSRNASKRLNSESSVNNKA